tara:strand:- start:599 stop:793 length:195 start_codon:yes stop_codon:yes gene_type:complete
MILGVVKKWNNMKGWGFIVDENGDDYFVHISNVRSGHDLKLNSRVKFDISEGDRGPEAENVSLV